MSAEVSRQLWSPEAEQSVLGALMLDPDAPLRIADRGLAPAHFFDRRHGVVFAAVTEMVTRRLPVDVISVHEWLRERGQAEECGGLVYLNALQQCVPSATNIGRHADLVRDRALRRAIVAAADQACNLAQAPGEADGILDRVASLFSGIQRAKATNAPERLGDLMAARVQHWEALQAGTIKPGIPTGLSNLDEALGGGLKSGKVVVIGGQPSTGKSSFAQHLAQRVGSQGHCVLICSQEMKGEDLADRAAANLANVNLDRVVTGSFSDDDWSGIAEAIDAAASLPLYIVAESAMTLLDIRARARQIQHQHHGLAVIVVDYLQLCGSTLAADTRHHQIEVISRGLKALAMELSVCVVVLSQLKRIDGREPELGDLKESGSIGEDADVVILLHPMGMEGDGSMLVLAKLPKNRQGRRGRLALSFDGRTQRWTKSTGNVSRRSGSDQ